MSSVTEPYSDEGHPRRWHVLAVMAAVAFMAQLDLFIVNVALPEMGSSFPGAGLSSLSWVLNAYAIVFAALLVPSGRLADHFGRKRFLLAGVATFTLASVLCAVAPSLALLVAGRAIQAVGAALIVPASLGLLMPAFPKRQHTTVVGIWAGVAAIAATSGPVVGGLLVAVDWRWIFIVNVPIGIVTLVAGLRILPEVRAEAGARLPDGVSVLALLAAVTLLVLATVQGPERGWADLAVLALFVAAVVATVVTVLRTIRHPHALIEAHLFRNAEFTRATIALALFFVGFASWLLVTVLFLQNAWGYSPLRTGLAIAPGPAFSALFAINGGRIAARFGRRVPAVAGPLALAVAGLFWLLATPSHPDYVAGFLPGMVLGGIGAGLTQAPLFAAASTLPPDRATTGSAILNMARQLGSAIGLAILVAVLATPKPHELATFHRGWLLLIGASLAAAATSAWPRRGQTLRTRMTQFHETSSRRTGTFITERAQGQ
jgi:EmrB/QacA subfamily drug resistance transporter